MRAHGFLLRRWTNISIRKINYFIELLSPTALRLKYVHRDPHLRKILAVVAVSKTTCLHISYEILFEFLSNHLSRPSSTICFGLFSSKCCCVRRWLKQQVSDRDRVCSYTVVVVAPQIFLGSCPFYARSASVSLHARSCDTTQDRRTRVQTVIFFYKFSFVCVDVCVCVCVCMCMYV